MSRCAAGSNWMNHGTFGELLCHLTTGTRQRDWRPDTDPSFPKYPRLPIIERSVHEPKFANNASDCRTRCCPGVRSVHGSRSLRDSVARGQNSDNDAQLVESYAAAANSRGSK